MSGSGEDAQSQVIPASREEIELIKQCMREGMLLRGAPVALGMFALLEIRKQRVSGFVGLTIARLSKIEECKKQVLERFPHGQVARMESSMNSRFHQNQVEGNTDSSDSSQDSYAQRDGPWSGSDSYNTSDGEQYPESSSNNNPTRGLTWREAREKYRAGTLPGKTQQEEESGFFTDTDSAPRSNSGKNKYGDSWDTSN